MEHWQEWEIDVLYPHNLKEYTNQQKKQEIQIHKPSFHKT